MVTVRMPWAQNAKYTDGPLKFKMCPHNDMTQQIRKILDGYSDELLRCQVIGHLVLS